MQQPNANKTAFEDRQLNSFKLYRLDTDTLLENLNININKIV